AAEPKSLDDWRDYVRMVAGRYDRRVRYYEIWNEPNFRQFYTGTVDGMISLVAEARRLVKQVDSTNVVVSPAAATVNGIPWLEDFLKHGGGQYVDVIGFHFYVSPKAPEDMVPLIQRVHDIAGKYGLSDRPIWNTETGWFIGN